MADFGLAAQIGRGGGGGNAMAQPADPANQMMRMLQLQQLQQNMMLAAEQEKRAAALEPLKLRNLEADIRGSVARASAAETQGQMLGTEREEQLRKLRVNRGMIDVMDRADRGILDLSSPEGLSSITDPEVRSAVRSQLTEARAAADKAQKANLELGGVQRAIAYNFVDRFGEGITGPRQYQAARDKILKVDPTAAEFLPDNYNADNASRLRDFVRERKTTIQMVNGVPIMVTEGSPVATELTIQRAPQFGNLSAVQPSRMAPDMAARAAAGVETGVTPIIGARQPSALPASEFIAQREEARRKTETAAALPKAQSGFVAAAEALDTQLRTIDDLSSRGLGLYTSTGAIFGRTPSMLPGDPFGAAGARALINQLKAKSGLTALTDLKQAGGTLGQVSNEEGRRLENSVAALDRAQSTEDFTKQLQVLRNDVARARQRLGQAFEREYGMAPPETASVAPTDVTRTGPTNVTVRQKNGRLVPMRFPTKEAADAFLKKAGQ